MKYVIGTRGSKLAFIQAQMVRDTLKTAYPEDEFELKVIQTKGDQNQNRPLNELGSQGIFVREIEEELLSGKIDMAVHSMKDMPARLPDGLLFAKSWRREDQRDVLILREKNSMDELAPGAVIATGSIRRSSQLLKIRPDLKIVGIRGNIDTRIKKMIDEKYDGIVLAAAGIHRLGKLECITQYFSTDEMIPAPAQGVLGLELREDNLILKQMLDALADESSEQTALTERCFLREMNADCHVPIGAACQKDIDGTLHLSAVYGDATGNNLVYAGAEGNNAEETAAMAAKEIRRQLCGKVSLVGAGPGDPGLITVKGMSCVREADCIVYDRLSAPELLNETSDHCEKIYVGKMNHHHVLCQDEINELLVEKAMQYKHVVRLKGGDVYVFGRGGEEGRYLRQKGIDFEVVPGVSSALAGLASAGIPITHRGMSGGFHVVTAHNQKDEMADIDFKAMAGGNDTCIFLMGLNNLPRIAEELLKAGMSGDMPAAVISNATTNAQKTCVGRLSTIVEDAKRAHIESPALIAFGKVIELREELNVFEHRPLFGKVFLYPRIGTEPSGLTMSLRRNGAIVQEIQVGEIVFHEVDFTKILLRKVTWIIFTSKNGVRAFFQNLLKRGLDVRIIGNIRISCVGAATAAELEKYAVVPDFIPDQYNSDALYEMMQKKVNENDHVLYITAEGVKNSLSSLNCHVTQLPVYKNESVCCEQLAPHEWEHFEGIFFTCASSVRRFFASQEQRAIEAWLEKGYFFSIGPRCTDQLILQGVPAERIKPAESFLHEDRVPLYKDFTGK